MISCFPELYPDELIYSQLARYYVYTGYMAYTFAAQDLFVSKTVRPDIDFVNEYTAATYDAITMYQTMESIIEKHTMFAYYGRFLERNRLKNAFNNMVIMQGNNSQLLAIPRGRHTDRRLRFCPLCVDNDRKTYNETYWHRVHQMQGVNICPVHKCYLVDTDVIIKGKSKPILVTAEEVVESYKISPILCNNEIEIRVAEYVSDVFQANLNLDTEHIGRFLHSKLVNTPYLSVRGEQRNIALFHKDFTEFYKDLNYNPLKEVWQIQKVFTSDCANTYDICLIALFLYVSAAVLVNMEMPKKKQEQLFDEKIFLLHEQGYNYVEIAKKLNAAYPTVKAIGEKHYKQYTKAIKAPLKSGIKAKDWDKIDKDTLPLVKEAIKELQADTVAKPKRITIHTIEKMLNLKCKQIDKMPLCKAEVERYTISQEEHWAKLVVWAAEKILDEVQTLTWRHIRELTNIRKENFVDCFRYLPHYADKEIWGMLRGIFQYK